MEEFLERVLERLGGIEALKYVDENWGQIEEYRQRTPAKFPMALVDVDVAEWKNQGGGVQDGEVRVTVTVATLRLSNSSGGAPRQQRKRAMSIYALLDDVHNTLHRWRPTANSGGLIRTATRKQSMADGIKVFEVEYTATLTQQAGEQQTARVGQLIIDNG